jgi:hypothetical protein
VSLVACTIHVIDGLSTKLSHPRSSRIDAFFDFRLPENRTTAADPLEKTWQGAGPGFAFALRDDRTKTEE